MGIYLLNLDPANYGTKMLYYDEYFNFTNFYHAFLLIFRSGTGENWPWVMSELGNGIHF